MGQQYLLGLDNGGTVTKAALYATNGRDRGRAGMQVKPIMEKNRLCRARYGRPLARKTPRRFATCWKIRGQPKGYYRRCGHGTQAAALILLTRREARRERHHLDRHARKGICRALERGRNL
ncbi:MAG: hypothetical protein R2912_12420 [Eubacteriales bacterium]